MRAGRRRWWVIGLMLILLVGLISLEWVQHHTIRPLLDSTTAIILPGTSVSILPQVNIRRDDLAGWLSNGKLAYERCIGPRVIAVCFDPKTGAETSLSGLNPYNPNLTFGRYTISPDGKWLLQCGDIFEGSQAIALDGSHVIHHKLWHAGHRDYIAYASNPLWMPNCRRWTVLTYGDDGFHAIVESLDLPGILRRIPLGHLIGTVYWDSIGARLLGFTNPGRMLALATVGGPAGVGRSRKIYFFSFNIGAGPADLKQYSVSLPKTGIAEVDEIGTLSGPESVALSPRGDRLAWLALARAQPSPLVGLLSRWFASLRNHPLNAQFSLQLCISRMNGKEMRVIASMPLTSVKNYLQIDNVRLPYDLRWLPDGKRLSFIYKDALYTVPAD